MRLGSAEPGEPIREDRASHRGNEEGVGARANAHMLIGRLSRPRANGIDDDEPATACLERPQARRHVRGRPERAIRDEWVGAEHEHEVGAVDVGDGDRQSGAEHEAGGHLGRHLIDGARGEDIARAEGSDEGGCVERGGGIVDVRIAEEESDCAIAVGLADRTKEAIDLGPSLVPGGPVMLAIGASDERKSKSCGVVVKLPERDALGAHVAAGEDIRFIASDLRHLITVEGDLQAAGRLAQRAGPKCCLGHGPSVGVKVVSRGPIARPEMARTRRIIPAEPMIHVTLNPGTSAQEGVMDATLNSVISVISTSHPVRLGSRGAARLHSLVKVSLRPPSARRRP